MAVTWDAVFRRELEQIGLVRARKDLPDVAAIQVAGEPDPNQIAANADLIGLALSGGGIRSATFSLGVLQGLAKRGLLHRLDYLSTVSGGGYIGSWLTAWIGRTPGYDPIRQVQDALTEAAEGGPEPHQITHLRKYSNYLTPQAGLLSADTWTMVGIWCRNTLLNLITLVSLVSAALLVPRLLGMRFAQFAKPEMAPADFYLLIALLLAIAVVGIGINLNAATKNTRGRDRNWIQYFIVIPVLAASVGISYLLCTYADSFVARGYPAGVVWQARWWFGLFILLQVFSGFPRCYFSQHKFTLLTLFVFILVGLLSAAVSAFVLSSILFGMAAWFSSWDARLVRPWAGLCFGPLLVMLAMSVGVIVQIGMLGRDMFDSGREWLARLRAWLAIYGLGWTALSAASVYGPMWLATAANWSLWSSLGISAAWIGSTLFSVIGGASSSTTGEPAQAQKSKSATLADLATSIGPLVFTLGFVLAISFGLNLLLVQRTAPSVTAAAQDGFRVTLSGEGTVKVEPNPKPGPKFPYLKRMSDSYWTDLATMAEGDDWQQAYKGPLGMFAIAIAVMFLFASRVDVNEFSMHHFYKNRLVRCYLGATNLARQPNYFTSFDSRDDFPFANIATAETYTGPLQIVNTTLNISAPKNLAWQERKAASFALTPLFSGYDAERDAHLQPGGGAGYEATSKCSAQGTTNSIGLGTAMAISGAAANPNWGYHTSTAVAFLLTVFDVRLGWWLGNPKYEKYFKQPGPGLGLIYLVSDLFGTANSESNYVSISDGGHFDNMGLYELVRRRCRYIVVSDAEQDSGYHFGGLTRTIRQCRIDFGAEIEIDLSKLSPKDGALYSEAHSARGVIRYRGGDTATLLYLKASLTGDEPPDVLGYRAGQQVFPHQSTADQWFEESQFESYRRLGLHIADGLPPAPSEPAS